MILENGFLSLHDLGDDLRLLNLDRLHLVLHASVDGRVMHFWHLYRFLLDDNLRHLDSLFDNLWFWYFDCDFDGILNDPFLSLDNGDMNNLFPFVRHMDVNVVVNVHVMVAVLTVDRRHVNDFLPM